MPIEQLTALIVEDKPTAKEALEKLLGRYAKDIALVGWARDVKSAVAQIKQREPHILFLDIQLGAEQSFDILRQIDIANYHIIFTTAYEHYAIEAFTFSAIDYLLKPIDPERLQGAINRLRDREARANMNQAMLDALLQNTNLKTSKSKKLVLSTMEMLHVVDTVEIVKCQSSLNYTTFFLEEGKEIMVSRTLKEYEEMLQSYGFFRVHKSWLINMEFLIGYDKREGGFAVMRDESKVPVSTNKREELMKILKEKAN